MFIDFNAFGIKQLKKKKKNPSGVIIFHLYYYNSHMLSVKKSNQWATKGQTKTSTDGILGKDKLFITRTFLM